MSIQLDNKIVVILGGAGLLGSEFSRQCAQANANVIIVDIDEKKGGALVDSITRTGARATFIKANVVDEKSLTALVRTLTHEHERIDGLIHAAYPKTKNYGKPIETADAKELLENLDFQLGGPLLATRAFFPLLQSGSSVVFLSSIYGVAAPRFEIYEGTALGVPAEYAGIKGGIISLTRYFASLLGKRGVRVNAVSPGGIFDDQAESFVKAYSRKALLAPGMLTPKEIAGAVMFLVSDASEKITGQNLVVDGGWTL